MSRFQLGRVVLTPNAQEIDSARLRACLARHAAGDWGEVTESDRRENECSIVEGARLWSAFAIDPTREAGDDNKFWIITEADRSATTILLPEDY